MKKTLIALLSSVVFLFGAEPSAFKAGDLDNPNPYGLTSAEKKILEQNQNIQNNHYDFRTYDIGTKPDTGGRDCIFT
mgnify:CR=1 FL=1